MASEARLKQAGSVLSATHIFARHVINRELPVFTGKPKDWLFFISNYEQSTVLVIRRMWYGSKDA